jgi:hypothetical protein
LSPDGHLHEISHGESFLDVVARQFRGPGLYLLVLLPLYHADAAWSFAAAGAAALPATVLLSLPSRQVQPTA